ncbi:hypothetical protein N7U49_22480 [Streptomyces sp. AD2-2]|nr:hypothetical protein N7U49_22480 [Streptomyces sp. AD2-2]
MIGVPVVADAAELSESVAASSSSACNTRASTERPQCSPPSGIVFAKCTTGTKSIIRSSRFNSVPSGRTRYDALPIGSRSRVSPFFRSSSSHSASVR